jgi:hypothetical protein
MSQLRDLSNLGTGLALDGMLLATVINTTRTTLSPTRLHPLLLARAIPGPGRNPCALLAYAFPKGGVLRLDPLLTAAGFSVLESFRAVAVHATVRHNRHSVCGRLSRAIHFEMFATSACWLPAEKPAERPTRRVAADAREAR